jgi:hypothetical protein
MGKAPYGSKVVLNWEGSTRLRPIETLHAINNWVRDNTSKQNEDGDKLGITSWLECETD